MRGIRSLFPNNIMPFHAAFVAEEKNIPAYQRCDFPLGRTFSVSKEGDVFPVAVSLTNRKSYQEMDALCSEIFPPLLSSRLTLKRNTDSSAGFIDSGVKSVAKNEVFRELL